MATITFKAKVHNVYTHDDGLSYKYIKVPVFKKHHCDMDAFSKHEKYGSFSNSTLFYSVLSRIRNECFPHGVLKLNSIFCLDNLNSSPIRSPNSKGSFSK